MNTHTQPASPINRGGCCAPNPAHQPPRPSPPREQPKHKHWQSLFSYESATAVAVLAGKIATKLFAAAMKSLPLQIQKHPPLAVPSPPNPHNQLHHPPLPILHHIPHQHPQIPPQHPIIPIPRPTVPRNEYGSPEYTTSVTSSGKYNCDDTNLPSSVYALKWICAVLPGTTPDKSSQTPPARQRPPAASPAGTSPPTCPPHHCPAP